MPPTIFSKNNWCDFIIQHHYVWGSKETVTQYLLFLEARKGLILNGIIGYDTEINGRFYSTDTGHHIINESLTYEEWVEKNT